MSYFIRKNQIQRISAMIEALSYMTPEERKSFLEYLTNELKKIDNQIAVINQQQKDIENKYTRKVLTPGQVKTLILGCGIGSYALGGMLGTISGTPQIVGLVSSILLTLPLSTLAIMGIENDVINNRKLIKQHSELGKSKKELVYKKQDLIFEIHNAQAYSIVLDEIANKEFLFLKDFKDMEK